MLAGDTRWFVGIGEQPAVKDRSIVTLGRISPFLPRVGSLEPLCSQISLIQWPGAARGVQTVIALVRLEAALREIHALGRSGVDPEPGNALEVGGHVSLADQHIA